MNHENLGGIGFQGKHGFPEEAPANGQAIHATGQFTATVPTRLMVRYVDVLAGLPLDTRPWSVPVAGVRLWRGLVDDSGRAMVELLGDDERHWGPGAQVVARVDVGLRQGV